MNEPSYRLFADRLLREVTDQAAIKDNIAQFHAAYPVSLMAVAERVAHAPSDPKVSANRIGRSRRDANEIFDA